MDDVAALDAGFNVLVEKPMVTRSDHAKKLAEKVKQTGLLLQVSFQASYSCEFAYIREVLKNGGIGELQTVTAWSHQGWRSLGNQRTWRHDPKLSGGGQMYDTGAHLFNAIARAIVAKAGGALQITSQPDPAQPNHGATVTLRLPVATEP